MNETKTFTVIRKQIHKKCVHDVDSVVISYENCQLIYQSDWIQEGIDSKKEIKVSFPNTGKAFITVSNTCDLFPIRPFKADFTVIEAMQEQPLPPSKPDIPPSNPPSSPEISPTPTPETPPTSLKPDNPSVSPATLNESAPVNQPSLSSTQVSLNDSIVSIEPAFETPETTSEPIETKWTDYFMRYQFYILIMLLLLSILLNITAKNQFRPIIQLVSLGYLGFFTGGCLCTIGLIEKAALFKLSTAMGIFSIVFLGLLFTISIFFGRVFCGWVCPQGSLQEFLFRFPSKKALHHKKKNFFPLFITGMAFISVFFISFFWRISLICAYDPFTVAFQLAGNAVVIVLFLITAIVSLLVYRPFCKFICPLGFFLGLASWIGEKLKIRWTGKTVQCSTCTSCKKECLSQALIEKQQELLISSYDCIECGSCHQSCSIQKSLKKDRGISKKKQAE